MEKGYNHNMPEGKKTGVPRKPAWEKKLQERKEDEAAVEAIRRLYNCSEEDAREAWGRMVDVIIEEERERQRRTT